MTEIMDEIGDLLFGERLTNAAYHSLEALEMPQPYRQLLCHRDDMTSTLARFHGGEVTLRIFQEVREAEVYKREVLLSVKKTPVEYGVIRFYLENFPDPERDRILSGKEPLGSIVTTSGMEFRSSPRRFLAFPEASFTREFFPSSDGETLYGRYNCLINAEGQYLARILEILPPTHL
jgi:chorismate-pyruvate lyase